MNAPDHKAVSEAIARMELRGDHRPPQFHADLDLITAELEKLRQRCGELESLAKRVAGAPQAVAGAAPGKFYYAGPCNPIEHGKRVALVEIVGGEE